MIFFIKTSIQSLMNFNEYKLFSIKEKEQKALQMLEYYYTTDDRPFCVAYSGGKDSTALVYLTIKMLENLIKKNIKYNTPKCQDNFF